MKIVELLSDTKIEKISPGRPSAMYWASVLSSQVDRTSNASIAEIEAAILDGAKNKFMLRSGDSILGAIAFSSDEDYVHIQHLGSIQPGAGSELIAQAEKFAKRKKLPVSLVPSTVAKNFYKKHGYSHTGPGELWTKSIFK